MNGHDWCGTCGEPIVRTFEHGWVHDLDADAAIVAGCADARGDDPIERFMVVAR